MDTDYHEYCTGGYDPDDIVISGMSGRFPECDSVGELKESLYNKKDLVIFRDDRYEKGAMNAPYSSCGLVRNLDKFDANFFLVTPAMANTMDPASRIHIEVSYEAIADAGYDAIDLKGQKIGIFNATVESDELIIKATNESYSHLCTSRSYNANRTSYVMDFIGKK
ncbi:fatty acid synthase [Nephila pilipes]|uniref:Fatty acid synthase n=1 Tax=Nephila pilipes TaxID=299642 RepID=A0A8X6ML36_NEPPI|nr:fatty acid synthase [Nephila pilipes]GFS83875.1 fatty acid synthase [Nephila pilipes]